MSALSDIYPSIRVLGVMTGTSCDGLDAACLEFHLRGWKSLWSFSEPFLPSLKKTVLEFQNPQEKHPIRSWLELDRDLGNWYGSVLKKACLNRSSPPEIIAHHGQTLAHFPKKNRMGATLQLGDPSRIAQATGLTVISHFRQGDLAAGGQGAPFAPLYHALLMKKAERFPCAIQNIGGIANLTYLSQGEITAFDSGPGNIWIDAAAALASGMPYDKDGKIAQSGRPDRKAVAAVLREPYFAKAPPKSTGRDDFPFELLLKKTRAKGANLVATATEITAASIARAYRDWVLKKNPDLKNIYICGGGAKNKHLLSRLRDLLRGVRVSPIDNLGIDSQMVEAQAFAYLGYLSLLGIPLSGPWTGATGFAPPGWITPGRNWPKLVIKAGLLANRASKLHPAAVHSDSVFENTWTRNLAI